jgi:hypothetical protein
MTDTLDFYVDWNSDFIVTPSGSIQTAVGWDRVRQRIIRRIITNSQQKLPSGVSTAADYVFHPDFGLSGGALVDADLSEDYIAKLEQIISQGVLEDADVDSTTPPTIQYSRPNNETLWEVSVILKSGVPGQLALKYGPQQPTVPTVNTNTNTLDFSNQANSQYLPLG